MAAPPPPPGFTEDVELPAPAKGAIPAAPAGFTEDVDPTGQSYLGGLARTALGQGMLLGWGDEAIARVRQLQGEEYEKALEDERAKVKSFQKANPKTAFAAELAGGFATPGLGLAGGIIKPAATFGKRVLQSSAIGSGIGAVAGAGGADENRLRGAAGGAAVGATLGAAIPPVTSAIGAAAKAAQPLVSPTLARWKADLDALRTKTFLPGHETGALEIGPAASAGAAAPPAVTGAQASAEQMIALQLMREGVKPEKIRELLDKGKEARRFNSNSYAQDTTALVDTSEALQRLAASQARGSPEFAKHAKGFITGRQTGITPEDGSLPASSLIPTQPMMSQPLRAKEAEKIYGTRFNTPDEPGRFVPTGQGARVLDAFKRALTLEDSKYHGHGTNALRTDQELIALQKLESKSLYGAAHKAAEGYDISQDLQPVIDRMKQVILSSDTGKTTARLLARGLSEFEKNGKTVTSLKAFDEGKQAVDAIIETAARAGDNNVGRILRGTKDEPGLLRILLGGVDNIQHNEIGKKYAAARAGFSSRAEAREALQAGRDAWKADSDIGVDAFLALAGNDGNEKLFRLGLLSGAEKAVGGMRLQDDKTRLFDNPRIQELLSEVIPRSEKGGAVFSDRPERFGQYLGNAKREIETRNFVRGGSPTQRNKIDDEAMANLNIISDAFSKFRQSGSALNIPLNLVEAAFNKVFGMHDETARSLARMLFTANDAERRLILSRVAERMGPSRFAEFAKLMQNYAQPAAVGSSSQAAGSAVGEINR